MPELNSIYLDNAAAAPVSAETLEVFKDFALRYHGNQESDHAQGRRIRAALEEAESTLTETLLDDSTARVFWVDSGTTALTLITSFPFFASGAVVTTAAEHPALAQSLRRLGVNVKRTRLDGSGLIDLDHFASSLNEQTRLVAIHHVQGVTGAVQDLVTIRRIMDERSPQATLLADTVQSVGKLTIPWRLDAADFVVVSGHKIGTPGGGAIIQGSKNSKFKNFFDAARSKYHTLGRPNPPTALTLTETLRRLHVHREILNEKINRLSKALTSNMEELSAMRDFVVRFPVPRSSRSPFINGLLIPDRQGAVLSRMLSDRGVFVSSGSACEAALGGPNPALLSMGYSKSESYSFLRVSFWRENEIGDVERFSSALLQALADY